jgi:hypothetical protein
MLTCENSREIDPAAIVEAAERAYRSTHGKRAPAVNLRFSAPWAKAIAQQLPADPQIRYAAARWIVENSPAGPEKIFTEETESAPHGDYLYCVDSTGQVCTVHRKHVYYDAATQRPRVAIPADSLE